MLSMQLNSVTPPLLFIFSALYDVDIIVKTLYVSKICYAKNWQSKLTGSAGKAIPGAIALSVSGLFTWYSNVFNVCL
jgi:hypothetical protein